MSSPHWQYQAWESDFFGMRTARLGGDMSDDSLREALAQCEAAQIQIIHWLVDADDDSSVRRAEQHGFRLIDVRLTFEWRHTAGHSAGNKGAARSARAHQPGDLAALQAIARTSYHDTRYYHDRRYPAAACDAMYATWIARSCQGDAQAVLVVDQDGAVAGFITCHHEAGATSGQIGLVGVGAAQRGRGHGRILVEAAQQWLSERGADHMTVVTQGRNLAAQRLYQRCGFVTRTMQLWYHR